MPQGLMNPYSTFKIPVTALKQGVLLMAAGEGWRKVLRVRRTAGDILEILHSQPGGGMGEYLFLHDCQDVIVRVQNEV